MKSKPPFLKVAGPALALGVLTALAGCSRHEQAGRMGDELGTQTKVERGSQVVTGHKVVTTHERVPTVETQSVKADINRMDRDDFVAVGFPRTIADNILQYRKDHKFRSVDELRGVPGMDQGLLASLRDKLGANPTG